MYKKTIKYTDYDGNKREEDFYFNITKAELLEMEMSEEGGLQKMINQIVATQDKPKLIALFKKLVLTAYGEKSADGKMFIKEDPVTGARLADKFKQTEAYSELFMLLTNTEEATTFVNGITPKMEEQAAPKLVTNN